MHTSTSTSTSTQTNMYKPIVVGITGSAHSGKDTSADYILEKLKPLYGEAIIKIAFADQLKHVCQKLIQLFYNINIPLEEFYDIQKKEQIRPELPPFAGQSFKLRTILQLVGTEIFRDMITKSVWCNYIKEQYITCGKYKVIIISDVRMPNEMEFITQLYLQGEIERCICFRVSRPTKHDQIDHANQMHSTEKMISSLPVSLDILNNGTLEQLYVQLDQIITDLSDASLSN